MWKISIDENRMASGFYPPDYHGELPADTDFIEVSDEEKERVYGILPAFYDKTDGTFKHWTPPAPTLDTLKTRKKAEIAAARYEVETAGITVNDATIDTGRDSQALITGAAVAAMLDENYSLNWKTETGFIHLIAPEIIAVAQAVRAHVQSCFDREGELCEQIDAAQTPEELDAIQWSF